MWTTVPKQPMLTKRGKKKKCRNNSTIEVPMNLIQYQETFLVSSSNNKGTC
jgi:hypothetical protein